MTSGNATSMDVELDYTGDPTPEQIMEIDAEEVGDERENQKAKSCLINYCAGD